MTLGWDAREWRMVFDWAKEPISSDHAIMARVREKWFKAGMPAKPVTCDDAYRAPDKLLVDIIGRLRTFFLAHHAEAPIAIVLDDRKALDLMRSICHIETGWRDITALNSFMLCGVKFRFERG